jgi:hypothetical protein
MKPAKNIEKHIKNIYVESLPATTSAELDERVLGNVMEALEESKKKNSAAIGPNIWRIIMRSRTTKFATAAVIIIAVLISIHQFGGSSVAWASVVKNVEQAKTVSFRLKTSMTGMPDSEIMVYDSSEYGSRMDVYHVRHSPKNSASRCVKEKKTRENS